MSYQQVTQPYNFATGGNIHVNVNIETGELMPFFFYHNTLYTTGGNLADTRVIKIYKVDGEKQYVHVGLHTPDSGFKQAVAILNEYSDTIDILMEHMHSLKPQHIPESMLIPFTPPPYLLPTVPGPIDHSYPATRFVIQPRTETSASLSDDRRWVLINNDQPMQGSVQYIVQVAERSEKRPWDELPVDASVTLFSDGVKGISQLLPTTMQTLLLNRAKEKVKVVPGLRVTSDSHVMCHKSGINDTSPSCLGVYTLRSLYMVDGQLLEPKVMQVGEYAIPYYDAQDVPKDTLAITHRVGRSIDPVYASNQVFDLLRTDVEGELIMQRLHLQQRFPDWYKWLCYETNQVPPVVLRVK